MTSREHVRAAIDHRPAERVPYAIDLCPDAADALRTVYGDVDMCGFINNDVLDISVPWWDWYHLADDWQGYAAPTSRAQVIGRGSYVDLADQIKAARDQSDKYFLVRIYGSHFEKANFARGIENFLADMAGEPAFARALLNRIIEKNMVMLENFLPIAEIDGVLLGSDWGSQIDLLMSPDTWQEMIRPGEQREYDLVHSYGKDVWVHSCGNIEKVIPSLIEMGLDVLNPIQPEVMDIAQLKQRYGHALAFWGGISTQQTLPYGTPEQVKEEARRVRDLMSQGGGYIFAPAQSIQGDVPVANIMALLEVAREKIA
jgi:uroporphyrinogen-III decarboxylase